jgi:peptide-methionine (S)-S-oxide reductase
VAHDPTELNRQGPDTGTQYRSTIFPTSDAQKKVAEAYIAQLGAAKVFEEPIATTVETAKPFFPAEAYHQDYATLHPDSGYIAMYDLPKVDNLGKLFPDFYSAKPKLVADADAVN